MDIWCCGCSENVAARLTDGAEIYAHRSDLHDLPFWKCDICGNHVGCHHKTAVRTRPLGCIPTLQIKNARQHLHRLIDPIWKSKKMTRGEVYRRIAAEMGVKSYHTADLRSIEDARLAYTAAKAVARSAGEG